VKYGHNDRCGVGQAHCIRAEQNVLGDWKSFPQFLDDFLQSRFGSDWTEEQNSLDPPNRIHHILANAGLSHHLNALEGKPAGHLVQPVASCRIPGFAYDLYVVDDNNDLDERLLKRLKNRERFKSKARIICGGHVYARRFHDDHEDETGPGRHVELRRLIKSLDSAWQSKRRVVIDLE